MSFIWTIIIGFVAGIIAKFVTSGSHEPSGFIMTTLLGVGGALVAQFIFNGLGVFQSSSGAGLIGSIIGAIVVLLVWSFVQRRAKWHI